MFVTPRSRFVASAKMQGVSRFTTSLFPTLMSETYESP
nr:MAG TPA: hypothetical protein [Caudoviricetes sp.]